MQYPTISFYTLGCRLNQSETAVIRNSFFSEGYSIVDCFQPADIMVINTCTVTQGGEADTRRLINRLVRIQPETKIALVGCQAQIQKEKLVALKNVQWVIGNEHKMELSSILRNPLPQGKPLVLVSPMTSESFTMPFTGIDSEHTRANLKIQDGCDFFCAFCEIPYARGRARSRQFADIMKEAKTLVAAGHHELVITGINVGTYFYQERTIADIISALEDIPELQRIRISSIEPTTIPEKILQMMAGPSKLCRHLHVPLQCGNDGLLRQMKRKYTVAEYFDFINRAVAMVPGICIGSDIMVGFPGETTESFAASCELLRKSVINYFHVFSYSRRSLAVSKTMSEVVPMKEIAKRSALLRKMSQEKRRQFYQSYLGSRQKILWEQKKNGSWSGLTDNFIRVNMASDENLKNRFTEVKLVRLREQCVIGEAVH